MNKSMLLLAKVDVTNGERLLGLLIRSLSSAQALTNVTTSTSQQQQQQNAAVTHQKSDVQLLTAYSGQSKDYFYKRRSLHAKDSKTNLSNKNNPIFGDDSLFIVNKSFIDAIGIADGVGGWREHGVDPSKFSSTLMRQCKYLIDHDQIKFLNNEDITDKTPIDILFKGYNALVELRDASLIGSSTACVIVFNRETKDLYSANLGDSGYVIIRNNRVVHRSEDTCHFFNAPFQMALLPKRNTNSFNDSPSKSSVSSFKLEEGDFIVMATDGLWDNLFDSDIIQEISNIKTNSLQDIEYAVNNITNYALELAKDPRYMSPFAVSAQQYGIDYIGGKPDDISVIVSRVTSTNDTNHQQ